PSSGLAGLAWATVGGVSGSDQTVSFFSTGPLMSGVGIGAGAAASATDVLVSGASLGMGSELGGSAGRPGMAPCSGTVLSTESLACFNAFATCSSEGKAGDGTGASAGGVGSVGAETGKSGDGVGSGGGGVLPGGVGGVGVSGDLSGSGNGGTSCLV